MRPAANFGKERLHMKEKLAQIRRPKQALSIGRRVVNTLLILALGVGLGILSKWFDGFPELPAFIERLDIANFFGRMAVWLVIAICLAVFSSSAKRAAVNVFVFFAGMVAAYYLYSKLVAGFFPRSYAMIWFALTAVSPLLAAVTWYAKGSGWIATVISGLVAGCLAWTVVYIDLTYVSVTSAMDVVMLAVGIAVLRRKSVKEFLAMLGIGILTLLILQTIMPFPLG